MIACQDTTHGLELRRFENCSGLPGNGWFGKNGCPHRPAGDTPVGTGRTPGAKRLAFAGPTRQTVRKSPPPECSRQSLALASPGPPGPLRRPYGRSPVPTVARYARPAETASPAAAALARPERRDTGRRLAPWLTGHNALSVRSRPRQPDMITMQPLPHL
jgi:hypothetical protein